MPNRILKDGILSSGRVDKLDYAAEVFYRRLMSVVDDYGRFDGRAVILRSALYPLRSDEKQAGNRYVSVNDVNHWIDKCVEAELVGLYEVGGNPYIEVLRFDQRVRALKSKWPSPQHLPESARIRAHVTADDRHPARAPNAHTNPTSIVSSDGESAERGAGCLLGQHTLASLLDCYPKHRRGRPLAAYGAIQAAVDRLSRRAGLDDPVDFLRIRTLAYAKAVSGNGRYVPAAAKWFSEGGYDESDETWSANGEPSIDFADVIAGAKRIKP